MSFTNLKRFLKVVHFFIEKVIDAIEAWFAEQDLKYFFKVLEVLQVRCNKCI